MTECLVCDGRGTDSTGLLKCRCRKESDCMGCAGRKWMTLQPMNLVAPCVVCSPNRNLSDIEKSKGMRLEKNQNGAWYEALVQ